MSDVGINCVKCGGLVGPGMCSYIDDTCVQDFALEVQGEPETVAPETVAEFQVHCTPPAVAEQCLRAVLDGWVRLRRDRHGNLRGTFPLRVLDVCAGPGVWSQVLRRLAKEMGFSVYIEAVEVRPECTPHLDRNCDDHNLETVENFVATYNREAYDLIMGNPPFSLDDERAPKRESGQKSRLRAFEVLVVGLRELLEDRDSRLALYLPTDWWRTSNGCAALISGEARSISRADVTTYWPVAQYDLAQRASHNRTSGTSQDVYSCFVWDHPGCTNTPEWTTRCLPMLDAKAGELRVDVLPGTEGA